MKKQLSIELAGSSFSIEEEAYKDLHRYIEEFEGRFAQEEQAETLMEGFEEQVSAFFSEKQRFGMDTIKVAEVVELMERLGTAANYVIPTDEPKEEEIPLAEEIPLEEEASEPDDSQPKGERSRRLYRDVNNRMIGGVAAGLSNYLDIDVSIIRIVMLALCCFTFPIIVAYLIAWLCLKAEPASVTWEEAHTVFIKRSIAIRNAVCWEV